MQINRVTRQDPETWHLEVLYLGQHVNFTLAHRDMAPLIGPDTTSEAHAVDALREHKDELESAVKAVVGETGTPPEKFASLRIDRSGN